MRTILALLICIPLISSAAGKKKARPPAIDAHEVVTYYDRNHDGRVDYELHDFGCCDRNWALLDTNLDGLYDLRLKWSYSFTKEQVDMPTPNGVNTSKKDPEIPGI